MEPLYAFLFGLGILLFTVFFLEKQMARDKIFWLFSGLSVLFGLLSVVAVIRAMDKFDYYITFTVLFVLVAIFYVEDEESEGPEPVIEKAAPVGKKRKKRS